MRSFDAIRLGTVATALVLTGCSGNQAALDPRGLQASRLSGLWWIFFTVTVVVYVAVMAVLLTSLFRRKHSTAHDKPDVIPDNQRESRAGNVVKASVGITLVALFALMITSFRTGRAIDTLSNTKPDIAIKVIGHQWWWEIQYEDDANPSNNITTANEIHVPVGQPVKVMLESNDVIHSLWMPNMHGKRDLIPIHPTTMYFQADTPGMYWGQCAEFCGYQHAKMRFWVVAEPQEQFDNWIAARRATPPEPADAVTSRGLEIFKTSVCAQCHTIQGTGTNGRVGPDLTHVASRPYIAAGSYKTTYEHLGEWITDPQSVKPGIAMPMNQYSDEDLNALVTYIETLK